MNIIRHPLPTSPIDSLILYEDGIGRIIMIVAFVWPQHFKYFHSRDTGSGDCPLATHPCR
jgi:hypothetical protein